MANSFISVVIVTTAVIMALFGNDGNIGQNAIPSSDGTVSQVDISVVQKEEDDTESLGEEKIYPDSRIILYRFIPESELYDTTKLLDLGEEAGYNDIFNAVTDEVFPGKEIPPVYSISKTKEYIVCDFGEEWLDSFNKGELYEFCNTLVMTLCKNGFCESAGFRINGKTGLLGGEVWDMAELKVLETADPQQFTEIRASIPYSGLRISGTEHYFDVAKDLKKDDKAKEIHKILKLAGELTNEFDHPSDNDMRHAIQYLIWATEPVDIDTNSINYDVKTAQTIMPIAASISKRLALQENWFWIKEHIEQTARTVYGDDVVVKHQQPMYPYQWFETEGVYTPPHMGGAGNLIPHLYSYTDIAGVITAEVTYLEENMQGIYLPGLGKTTENYDEVDSYLANEAVRHIVTMQRADDGRLVVRSHHFKDTGGN